MRQPPRPPRRAGRAAARRRPSVTISAGPPTAVASTGTPIAIASTIERPNGSSHDGASRMSLAASTAATSERSPRNSTSPSRPSAAICSWSSRMYARLSCRVAALVNFADPASSSRARGSTRLTRRQRAHRHGLALPRRDLGGHGQGHVAVGQPQRPPRLAARVHRRVEAVEVDGVVDDPHGRGRRRLAEAGRGVARVRDHDGAGARHGALGEPRHAVRAEAVAHVRHDRRAARAAGGGADQRGADRVRVQHVRPHPAQPHAPPAPTRRPSRPARAACAAGAASGSRRCRRCAWSRRRPPRPPRRAVRRAPPAPPRRAPAGARAASGVNARRR